MATKSPTDVLADFKVAPARKVTYRRAVGAPVAEVVALRPRDDAAAPIVTRGVHERSGMPVLMLDNGATVQALPAPAVGAAIAGGVLTLAELVCLLCGIDGSSPKLAPAIKAFQAAITEARG